MKKLAIIVIGFVAIVFAGATFAYSHVFWLSTIENSDFNNVSENIYIDSNLEKNESEKILILLSESKERIRNKYGSFTAMPTIVITGTPDNAKKFGLGNFPGKAFNAPWKNYIVINHQKINVSLFAHELMHAQMREILGYWTYQTKIPTWFDEGIAMQVDLRDHYKVDYKLFSQQEINRVKTLNSPSEFWTSSKEENLKNYRSAKAAVQEILATYPAKELYSMLSKVRQGKEFSSVFSLKTKV
ncbi:MAG: hypothetical protein L3J00_02405 [Thiomicrorhabdus sp.]|nr:hypothetical protein [Thiomicrorhabdus sp.]